MLKRKRTVVSYYDGDDDDGDDDDGEDDDGEDGRGPSGGVHGRPPPFLKSMVKVGLVGMVRLPGLLRVLEDAVDRMTKLQTELCHFLYAFILWQIALGRPVPDLRYGQGIMRKAYQALFRTSARLPNQRKRARTPELEEFAEIYARYRPIYLSWNNAAGLSNAVSAMAKQFATNCMLNVTVNFEKRFRKWLKYKIEKHAGAYYSP